MTTTQWRAVRQPSDTADTDVFDVRPVKDSVNRFAREAIVDLYDDDGTKADDYPRGQRVELDYSTDGGSTWTRRLAGFVQDEVQNSQGATYSIEIVGYDHLLRRETIEKTYSSQSISTILNGLITTFTPVNYVGGNVTVVNDRTLSRTFEGEHVDEAISFLASNSANEEFGVNNDLEFFFQPRETNRAPSDIVEGDWYDYDLPTKGKRAVNRVKLFYGSGGSEAAVIVEDRESQNDLETKLGAPRNVVIQQTVTYPQIDNEDAATKKAREILNTRSVIQTGRVFTTERFGMEPTDLFRLEIPEKNIDADFRVAEIEYYWTREETAVTVAENDAGVEDVLATITDRVERIDIRDADTTVTPTQFNDLRSGVDMDVSATVESYSYTDDAFVLGQSELGDGTSDKLGGGFASRTDVTVETAKATESMLNMARDVWQGEAATAITHLGVGTDDTSASAADNALTAEAGRVELAGDVADGTKAIQYSVDLSPGTLSGTGIEELGLHDAGSGGNLYAHLTTAASTQDATTGHRVIITLTHSNAGDLQGVVTDKGQERVRDLLLGETNHEPTDMVYGTGTTAPATTDTALGSKQHEDTIDSTADRTVGVTDVVERITSGDANTTNFAEVGEENAADELLTRVVFEPLPNDVVFETNHQFQAKNG